MQASGGAASGGAASAGAASGRGERSRSELLFELGGKEHVQNLVVKLTFWLLTFWLLTSPSAFYVVSKSVYTLYNV